MKGTKFFSTMAIVLSIANSVLFAQNTESKRIAVLPFESIGIEEVYVLTSESLLRLEIGKLSSMDLISEKRTAQQLDEGPCMDIECAVEIGNRLNANQVVACRLAALGEKVVVQYLLVDVSSQKALLMDETTATRIEDMNTVMKRIAMSVVNHELIEENAEVGAIMEEETRSPRRRGSHKFFGISFGYLYPQSGYDHSDRSFTLDFRTGAELDDFSVGMQVALRKGLALNIFSSYLLSKKNLCPYVGGAFGFHWVSHHDHHDDFDHYEDGEKKCDGFELTANAGLRVFHTYNMQVILNLAYAYTLNDYGDKAIIFTIGLLR